MVLFALLISLGCSHIPKPEDKIADRKAASSEEGPQQEFSKAEEVFNSPEVKKIEPAPEQRPFRLRSPVKKLVVNQGFTLEGAHAHTGLDLKGRKGDPIFAAHDGTVIYAGSGFRGYGRMILLEYNSTWATLYGHLNRFKVRIGQKIRAGQKIGEMGRTGHATGVHLHFELLKEKLPIDPAPVLHASMTHP